MKHSALALVALLACTEAAQESPGGHVIDDKFLWGSATAGFQVEGQTPPSDWFQHSKKPGKVQDGDSPDDGPDQWVHYARDFDEARAMGHNAYRMSIEWPRVQPSPGVWDEAALAHYRAIFEALKARGIRPMVTLYHWTLPLWVQDVSDNPGPHLNGWAGMPGEGDADAAIVGAFAAYAGEMARRFGDVVDLWCTLNEPMVLIVGGYLTTLAAHPPGNILDLDGAAKAMVHMAYGHAAAYDAIHAADTIDADGDGEAALVGVASHLRPMDPRDPAVAADVEATAQLDQLFNWLLLDATVKGDLDKNFDGVYDDPGEGQALPALLGRHDYLGINYYTRSVIFAFGPIVGPGGIVVKGFPEEGHHPDRERTDVFTRGQSDDWEVYPEGFHRVLTAASQKYALPIYVTENGINDRTDTKRARYLVTHIAEMQRAMRDGADVRGYFHWSLVDNFEWIFGFHPRLGLLWVDYDKPGKPRRRTRGAAAYTAIIGARGVNPAIQVQFGQ